MADPTNALSHAPRYRVEKIRDGVRRGWWRVLRENEEAPTDVFAAFLHQKYLLVGEAGSLWVAQAIAREDAFVRHLDLSLRRIGKIREG